MKEQGEREGAGWIADGEGLAGGNGDWVFTDPRECAQALGSVAAVNGPDSSGEAYRLEHDVALTADEKLHVEEIFGATGWLRSPRRAVLFLNGSVFKGDSWHIPHPTHHAALRVAQRGMFAFTVDFLGSGRSSCPENGREATFARNVEALRHLLRHIRFHRGVDRVDLIGEGYGGAMATLLAADARRVRSCVMLSMTYKDMIGGPAQSPEFAAMIRASADGYFQLPAEAYDPFLLSAPDVVRSFVRSTQAGRYPTPVVEVVMGELPFFDPKAARAPGLVIHGARDFIVPRSDAAQLAADYGLRGATLVTSDAAGHAPRLESPEVSAWLWEQIFGFIDGDREPRDPLPAEVG